MMVYILIKNNILLFFILYLGLGYPVQSQDKPSAKNSRQAKKEMKEYYFDIEKFEKLKNTLADSKRRADSLNEALNNMQALGLKANKDLKSLEEERDKSKEEFRRLSQEMNESAKRKSIPSEGVCFLVQIGAFNRLNLSSLFNEYGADLSLELDSVGTKKYLLGIYLNYEEAAAARKKIRTFGAKDAWIVAYKDGKRVQMNEVRTTPISEEELKELKSIK